VLNIGISEPIEVLKQYFGYDSFRAGQEALIGDILKGRDVLGIMPTGAGKSICFQVPALLMDGPVIVISPLISLMKDQVGALIASGIRAAFINSSLSQRQIDLALNNAANGDYKLIYVAPERLTSLEFTGFAREADIPMVVVDEAHCISQWGQDFRPSYTAIPNFINQLRKRPILSAFTATATPRVREDIITKLALNDPTVLVSGFDRPNLRFDRLKAGSNAKYMALMRFLKDRPNHSGIIYCSTKAGVDEVHYDLLEAGYSAARYHSEVGHEERQRGQEDFLHDRVRIMVATNAFGMGIDKSNVSFVVHYNMPGDIEAYYQEAGRAGRDGEPADCLLLHTGKDYSTQIWLIENSEQKRQLDPLEEAELKERKIKRLNEMDFYTKTQECLRAYILRYFGENPPDNCGNCVNCTKGYDDEDITVEAQKMISCVARMKERFGATLVVDTLLGTLNKKVRDFGLNRLSTFGISGKGRLQLNAILDFLIFQGYLHKTAEKYPVIKLGTKWREALDENARIIMKTVAVEQVLETAYEPARALHSVNPDLLAALKAVRMKFAKEANVPAFVIFSDATLTDMCMKMPASIDQFMGVSGVGKIKAEKFGQAFLAAIAEFSNIDNVFEAKEFNPSNIEISNENVTVSNLADMINVELLQCGRDKLSGRRINDWLVDMGLLQLTQEGKIPTEAGLALGISAEMRDFKGVDKSLNFFTPQAQRFVVNNALKI
jgi:ATP-dependent DNA helicase RecQ